jgi:hypothetical protein
MLTMPGVNVPQSDGQPVNIPRAPLPAGVTCASACTERDRTGKLLQRSADNAVFAICSDARDEFGIVEADQLQAIEDAIRPVHHFAWAVATRQAAATRFHEYQGQGFGGGVLTGLPHALRLFPSTLLASFIGEEQDPRDQAALVAQAAGGGHELVEAAIGLGVAHVEAVRVARDFVSEDAINLYHERTKRHDQSVHVRPVPSRYMRPDYDRRGLRLINGRLVAEKALRMWAAEHGLSGVALDRLAVDVGCAYSIGFSLSRITPPDGHGDWLHTECRPEPLQRAASLALDVSREPKLIGRALDTEIVMGDFVHGAIARDIPTFANVLGASLAIRAAVRAVVAQGDAKADQPEHTHARRPKGKAA